MAKTCVCRVEAHFHWNTDAYTGSSTKTLKCFTKQRAAKKYLTKIRREFGPDDGERFHGICKKGQIVWGARKRNKKMPTSAKARRVSKRPHSRFPGILNMAGFSLVKRCFVQIIVQFLFRKAEQCE